MNEAVFWTACTEGDLATFKELSLSPSLDFNWSDPEFDRTPFYRACGHGQTEIVKALMSNPLVSVNQSNRHHATPLFIACQEGHVEVVKLLLADDRVKVNSREHKGGTALSIACDTERLEIVKLLLSHPEVDVNLPDDDLVTPFSIACEKGLTELVEALMQDPRVDILLPDVDNITPFFITCQNGYPETLKLLLADPRVDINMPNNCNSTPLWFAAQNGHLEVIQLILGSGRPVDLDSRSMMGESTWCNKTAAEIARIQAGRLLPDPEEPLEVFNHSKANGNRIADLLEAFQRDPRQIRAELRSLPLMRDPYIGEIFALSVFFSDDYLALRAFPKDDATKTTQAAKRFFKIMKELPMDLQMVLCNRLFSSPKNLVSTKYSEPGFRKLARVFWESNA